MFIPQWKKILGILIIVILVIAIPITIKFGVQQQQTTQQRAETAVVPSGPCLGKASGQCQFDTYAVFQSGSDQIESITAYGKFWSFDITNNYSPGPSNGSDLTSVTRYASGPCAGKAVGQCQFDTYAVFTGSNGHQIESITAYGNAWSFDISNNYAPTGRVVLTAVPRYANGPCMGQTGENCHFDTYAVYINSARVLEEVITAYGKYWGFDANTGDPYPSNSNNSGDLVSVSRYIASSGPCLGKASGQCQFDTYAVFQSGSDQIESITAYGKFWSFDITNNYSPGPSNGSDLTTIARYIGATTLLSPTVTLVPSSSLASSDTPTPTVLSTPTELPIPTAVADVSVDTPVGNTPTTSPTSLPTPTLPPIFTPTPRPSLPPTGPGDIFVYSGVAGIVVTILGVSVFILGI